MAIRGQRTNSVRHYYDQLDEDGDTVSNATDQTPTRRLQSELDGKTFKVADTVMVAGTEKDTILATFSFPEDTADGHAGGGRHRPSTRDARTDAAQCE